MGNCKLKTKIKHFKVFIKMDKTMIKFSDIEIKNNRFTSTKALC